MIHKGIVNTRGKGESSLIWAGTCSFDKFQTNYIP